MQGMPSVLLCNCWQRCLWGHSAAKMLKHIKGGCGNCTLRRMYSLQLRGNRCVLGRWVSPLLVLLTPLSFSLFYLYLFLLISLSNLPAHTSRWWALWLYFPSRRCSESRFKWKHPCIELNVWYCPGDFRFECDTSKIAQIIFVLEIVPCNCISLTGIISQASYFSLKYIFLIQNLGY